MSEPRPQVEESAERSPITGKVAALLNERELVINIGAEDGVAPKMKFRVLAPQPVEVHDPDSGDMLGEIEQEKVRVQASDVEPKMTICSTYELRRSNMLTLPSELVSSERGGVRTLRTGDRGYLPQISERDSYVKIGDIVEEIL